MKPSMIITYKNSITIRPEIQKTFDKLCKIKFPRLHFFTNVNAFIYIYIKYYFIDKLSQEKRDFRN